MNMEYVRHLYDYHYWATGRILQAAEGLGEAEFTAATSHSHGSIQGTLAHMLSAEWMWLTRWQGTSPKTMLSAAEFPTLASVRERAAVEEQRMRTFISSLQDADLDRVVRYTNTKGKEFAYPLWKLMAHVVNHGTQHRSEVAAMLTDLGRSPGDLDMTVFLRERA